MHRRGHRNHNTLSYKGNVILLFFIFYKILFKGYRDDIVETLVYIGGNEK